MRTYFLIAILIVFVSCSKQKEKIDFLKSTLQIELQSEVKILENEVKHNELFLPDYTLNLTIGLNKNQMEKITDQITNIPYYNELEFYRWRDNSRNLLDNENYTFQTVQDSIAKTKYRGSWIKTELGFEFVDFGKTHDIVQAWLNTETNSLKFVDM